MRLLALVMALVMTVVPAYPASAIVGVATAHGSFRVDGATVSGNATVLEGTTLETLQSALIVRMPEGRRAQVSSHSSTRWFADRMELRRGESETTGIPVEALGLVIQPQGGPSTARVRLEGMNHVQVAALEGPVQVRNARGIIVANLAAGSALAFVPQAIPSLTRLSGVLHRVNLRYLLTDDNARVTVEVVGSDLAPLVGRRVEVTGSIDLAAKPFAGAAQVIRATQVRRLDTPAAGTSPAQLAQAAPVKPAPQPAKQQNESTQDGAAPAGRGPTAPPTAPSPAQTPADAGPTAPRQGGLNTTALVAIVGGIGVVGAVAGVATGKGSAEPQTPTTPPLSR